jgi:ESS family glutamate:Na+ symporter
MTYHLLNLSFVAMSLRAPADKSAKAGLGVTSVAVSLLAHYGLQALLGLGITFALIATIMPDLFPAFGFLLPLAFAAGPGQALSIGHGWEPMGFVGAGSVGLTFGALGLLWSCFGGVLLINFGIRRGWLDRGVVLAGDRTGFLPRGAQLEVGSRLTTDSEAVDSKTWHVAVVLLVYLLAYLLLTGVTAALTPLGRAGLDLARNLWGIMFIFCALVAMGVRAVVARTRVDHTIDDGSLTRVGGLCVDLMMAAALGAISLSAVHRYWLPILLMSALAGVLALVLVPWMGNRMFPDHRFGRALIVYGATTGTLATGLALLRVLDPGFKSPVTSDYMRAAGFVFVACAPLIAIINFPAYGHLTGDPTYHVIAASVCAAYVVVCAVAFVMLRRAIRRLPAPAPAPSAVVREAAR